MPYPPLAMPWKTLGPILVLVETSREGLVKVLSRSREGLVKEGQNFVEISGEFCNLIFECPHVLIYEK